MINNTDVKVSYQGDGVTTVFPFSFPFIQKSYIHVAVHDSITKETVTLTSDYYVDANAHTVTYPGYAPGQAPAEELQPPVLPSTSTITIYRSTDITQLTDLGDKYPLPQIEEMSDKLTEIMQEHDEGLSRAIKVPIGDPETPEEKYLNLQTYVAEAAASAAAAETSATNAAASEENAGTSAANAAQSAANAAQSEMNAAQSAASALNSANSAANSAGVATGAAASANASAVSAAASQQSAGASAAAAENSRQIATMAASSALESKTAAELAATTATSQAAAVGVLATNAENTMSGYAAYTAPPWDAATVYSYPTIVSYPDGNTYRCIGTSVPAGTVPPESREWIRITTRGGDDFWDIDVWGGYMPSENPTQSYGWTLDENGDFMPKDASDNLGREDKTIAEEALEAAEEALEKANELLDATPMELDDDGNVTPVELDEEEEEP